MSNEYKNNPQLLEDVVKDIIATYKVCLKKDSESSRHTEGYIKGWEELIAEDIKQYASANEEQINELYEHKIKAMTVAIGTDSYYDGYADAYDGLWSLCFGHGYEILDFVKELKKEYNLS